MSDQPVETTPGETAEIRLAGSLADLAQGNSTARVRPGQTILQAVVAMGLPPHQRFIATVNGRVCAVDYVLAPGDRAALFPPIAGGGRH
jgi:molybdopterin converting factor small subunit